MRCRHGPDQAQPADRAMCNGQNPKREQRPMNCAQCGAELPENARFCTNCGASTGITSSKTVDQGRLAPFKSSKRKSFQIKQGGYEGLISDIEGWLSNEGYKTSRRSNGADSTTLKIRSKADWKQLVGMHVQLSLHLECSGTRLQASTGEAVWADKLAVFMISWFCLWPLFITSLCGMTEQQGLPEKIFGFMKVVAE